MTTRSSRSGMTARRSNGTTRTKSMTTSRLLCTWPASRPTSNAAARRCRGAGSSIGRSAFLTTVAVRWAQLEPRGVPVRASGGGSAARARRRRAIPGRYRPHPGRHHNRPIGGSPSCTPQLEAVSGICMRFRWSSALLWLFVLQPGRNVLTRGARSDSRQSGAARQGIPSQPDRLNLSCLVAKMIFFTQNSHHPFDVSFSGNVIAIL